MTVVALSDVTKRFGRTVAVEVENLVLGPGAVAVLGPNGSGKSTLLRLVATVMAPDGGEIRIDGLDPADPTERVAIRRRLGYLTQHDALPDRVRVVDYLDYVGVLKEIEPARLRHRWSYTALHRMGLVGVAGDRIATLSGGMRRRLALGQALLGSPGLLVLDEPEVSLDPERRQALASLIAELGADASIVVATHLPDVVAAVCNLVVILVDGRVAFVGTPDELVARSPRRGREPLLEAGYLAVAGVSSVP